MPSPANALLAIELLLAPQTFACVCTGAAGLGELQALSNAGKLGVNTGLAVELRVDCCCGGGEDSAKRSLSPEEAVVDVLFVGFFTAGAPKKPPLCAVVTWGATGGDRVIADVRLANAFGFCG